MQAEIGIEEIETEVLSFGVMNDGDKEIEGT
jgi:hypothetical protein